MNEEEIVNQYLKDQDYKSIEDWAVDAGYIYNKHHDYWTNDDGRGIDLQNELYYQLEAAYLAYVEE